MQAGETAEQLLGNAARLRRAGRTAEAIEAYRRLLALHPDLAESWYNLAWLQRQARRFEESIDSYREALARGVREPEEVHLNRAVIFADHLARSDDALAELEAALAINPRYLPALLNLGNLHEDRGNRPEAQLAYERALEIAPDHPLALARLAGVARIDRSEDALIGRLRAALAAPAATEQDKADLGFSLGRALDAAGAYDAAFAAYRAANMASRAALGPDRPTYDRAGAEKFVDRLIAAFPSPVPAPAGIAAADRAPIFICGLFRSGSTLTEQFLARHSEVTPGGELDLLPDLILRELQPYPEAAAGLGEDRRRQLRADYAAKLRAIHPAARVVTDKRPDNFLHIGLIKTLFPEARIVHTRRHPLDNCLSMFFLQLDPGMAYATDLTDIAHWHGQYRRLLAHWKSLYPADIFDLDYDALVADPAPAVAALLDHCGLRWEAGCLAFHEARNPVRTASAWQVREPLYRRSSGRWRNYAAHLGELRAALDKWSPEE